MSQRDVLDKFGDRVGYSPAEKADFREGDPRLRHMEGLAKAAPLFSILAEVVKARHCSSGFQVGDRFVLDVDGNLITKLCPKSFAFTPSPRWCCRWPSSVSASAKAWIPMPFILAATSAAPMWGWSAPATARSCSS